MSKALYHTRLLSVDSSDSGPSLLLVTEGNRFLFNTPEGLSRVCVQSKIPLRKISNVFLGNLEQSGGLPGVILGVWEGGGRKIDLHGPKGLLHYLASCRSYTRRDGMAISVSEHGPIASTSELPPPLYKDASISVHAFVHPSDETNDQDERPAKKQRIASPPPASKARTVDPSALTGPEAVDWRQKVVRLMFKGSSDQAEISRLHTSSAYMLHQPLPRYDGPKRSDISYYVRTAQIRGKFKPGEAIKLGVRPGPDFAKLAAGQSIWVPDDEGIPKTSDLPATLSQAQRKAEKQRIDKLRKELYERSVPGESPGRWVRPEDCLGASTPGTGFLVLNLSTPDAAKQLWQLPQTLFDDSGLLHVYYFLGPNMLGEKSLADFASKFSSRVQHHICSPDLRHNNAVTFVPAATLNLRLSLMDPNLFRNPVRTQSSTQDNDLPEGWPEQTRIARRDDEIRQGVLAPAEHQFDFAMPSKDADSAMRQLKSAAVPAEKLEKAKEVWNEYVTVATSVRNTISAMDMVHPDSEYVVTPLGTGSAIPSKYRNVSSVLVHLPHQEGYVLLDAGEGTLGQLRRHFGDEGTRDVLRKLKIVSISHMHQDHHAGLSSVLRARRQAGAEDEMIVIAPSAARMYLFAQDELFDAGLFHENGKRLIHFIDTQWLEADRAQALEENDARTQAIKALRDSTGIRAVNTVHVKHRCRCWGLVIDHVDAGKLVYSGDTMPCDELVSAGQGAALLIHEATIEDSMVEIAAAKGHSTFGQAIDVGRRMHAKNLLLTHFSARYPKLPPVAKEELDGMRVGIAFDLCTMRMCDFDKMEELKKGMDVLFSMDEVKTTLVDVSTADE